MLLLIAGMAFGVISFAFLPHGPKDFEPSLTQAPQSRSVGGSARSMSLIKGLRPRAVFSAAIGPEMNGETQVLVAVPADSGQMDLAGLKTNWGGSRPTLQAFHVIKPAILADFAQEPWCQFLSRSRQ